MALGRARGGSRSAQSRCQTGWTLRPLAARANGRSERSGRRFLRRAGAVTISAAAGYSRGASARIEFAERGDDTLSWSPRGAHRVAKVPVTVTIPPADLVLRRRNMPGSVAETSGTLTGCSARPNSAPCLPQTANLKTNSPLKLFSQTAQLWNLRWRGGRAAGEPLNPRPFSCFSY